MDGFLRSGDNDVFRRLLRRGRPGVHPRRGARRSRPSTASSARCWPRRTPTASTCTRRSRTGRSDNDLPPRPRQTGFPDTTIFAALGQGGVSNRYFYSDIPFSALWGAPGLARSRPVQEYYERCAAARCRRSRSSTRLRRQRGRGPGTSGDEHPHGDVRTGQAFMADVVHAFMESPAVQARRAVHRLRRVGRLLRPRRARRACPTSAATRDINKDFGQMGFRIPAVAVSPYVAPRPRRPRHLRRSSRS